VTLARAFYYEIYFLFFRDPEIPPLSRTELATDIILYDSAYFSTAGCMCGQVMLRCLKSIRSYPEKFAEVLVKSYKGISFGLFAFSTFPAIFNFFTSVESIEFGVEFLLRLIELDNGECVVGPLFQSILFALWPFTDALWADFHRGFAAKTSKSFDEMSCMSGLVSSIERCGPLLPGKIRALIRRMASSAPELCASSVLTYLKITFELWYNHCPAGMSFGCGEPFMAFLEKSKDFVLGHSITIVSHLFQNRPEVLVYPFNCEVCMMACESMIFSLCDFEIFRKAFDGVEERPAMFQAIEVDDPLPRFSPYCLDFFPSPDRKRNGCNGRSLFRLSPRDDTLFDPSLFVQIHSDEAELEKAIAEDQQKLLELEECFRMKVILRHSRRFHESLVRYRNAAFGRYCKNELHGQRIPPKEMESVARQFLKHPREDPSLVAAILPEILRVVATPEAPPNLKERFWKIRQNYHAVSWKEVHPAKGSGRVVQLVPEATQRQLENFGEVFQLFSYLFGAVEKIRKKHSSSSNDFGKFVKFVSLGSQYEDIIQVFLFFDKLVFQNKFFISALNEKLVKVWSTFTQIMWSLVMKDTELSKAVLQFSAADI
jgi:hypothetical protein